MTVQSLIGMPLWSLTTPARLTIGLALLLNGIACGCYGLLSA